MEENEGDDEGNDENLMGELVADLDLLVDSD